MNMNWSKLKMQGAFAVAAGLGLIGSAPAAWALNQVTSTLSEPANLQASVSAFECENSPGPWINFEGAVTLAGLNVQLIFRNNINKDVHTRVEDIQTVVGVTTGTTIRIPKQPSHPFEGGTGTGVGGNPWISIQIVDSNGRPLSGEIVLGRCVHGVCNPTVEFVTRVSEKALTQPRACTKYAGPFIHVLGS